MGRQAHEAPIGAFTKMELELVARRVEQGNVRRIILVPVGTLVLVAAGAGVDQVLVVVATAPRPGPVMIDRQRGPDVDVAHSTVATTRPEPLASTISS